MIFCFFIIQKSYNEFKLIQSNYWTLKIFQFRLWLWIPFDCHNGYSYITCWCATKGWYGRAFPLVPRPFSFFQRVRIGDGIIIDNDGHITKSLWLSIKNWTKGSGKKTYKFSALCDVDLIFIYDFLGLIWLIKKFFFVKVNFLWNNFLKNYFLKI